MQSHIHLIANLGKEAVSLTAEEKESIITFQIYLAAISHTMVLVVELLA